MCIVASMVANVFQGLRLPICNPYTTVAHQNNIFTPYPLAIVPLSIKDYVYRVDTAVLYSIGIYYCTNKKRF